MCSGDQKYKDKEKITKSWLQLAEKLSKFDGWKAMINETFSLVFMEIYEKAFKYILDLDSFVKLSRK